MEVERTARVLDGSVLVIDAVAGVQAQTKTVWKAISRRGLPTIAFINKMDREGAEWKDAVRSITAKLPGAKPVILQFPIDAAGTFNAVVDLIGWKILSWKPSQQKGMPGEVIASDIPQDAKFLPQAVARRKELFDILADCDEDFMALCLEHDYHSIPAANVVTALRRASLSLHVMPVVFGSALRGKGIQSLLDAAVALLPAPLETHRMLQLENRRTHEVSTVDISKQDDLHALAFKVVHDHNRGPMVYARIYAGQVQAKQAIFNSTVGKEERVSQILSIQADRFEHIPQATTGTVTCLIGLKHTKTGDTLVLPQPKQRDWVLEGLTIPPSVYSVALETESESRQKDLEQALRWLCLEDPSLQTEIDQESGQTIVRGLGELHLEIVCDKLKNQYKLPVYVGQTYIGYRESLALGTEDEDALQETFTYDVIRENKRLFAQMSLRIQRNEDNVACTVSIAKDASAKLKAEEINVIQEALQNSCRHGRKGYPIVGLDIQVTAVVKEDAGTTTPGALRACVALFMNKLMQHDCHQLLEPIMEVEVTTPHQYMGDIITDLTGAKRGELKEVVESAASGAVITAHVPLQPLLGYATSLRSRTHGEAFFTAEYFTHKPV